MKKRLAKKNEMNEFKKEVATIIATCFQTMKFGNDADFGDYQNWFWTSLINNDEREMRDTIDTVCFEIHKYLENGEWGNFSFPPRDLEARLYKRIKRSWRELTIGEVKDLLPGWRERALSLYEEES